MGHSINLHRFKTELSEELSRILNYWFAYTPDYLNGGFYGKIDDQNHIDPTAPKGAVLNARILWSFAAGYNLTGRKGYLTTADRAYQYIVRHFIDPEFGGVYWSVDYQGNKLEGKKQVYASAFTIYALSEYYAASGIPEVKELAIRLYKLLEDKASDPDKTGYFEAFSQDWQPVNDQRLSTKDANEKKTANTHLHVLEAYANLYKIWPDDALKKHIEALLHNFYTYFIDQETQHLTLFFDENWIPRSTTVSYGHDIEAAWLLTEAARVTKDPFLVEKFELIGVKMAESASIGIDQDGGMKYELSIPNKSSDDEKHWWVQAETMLGFYNAWQLSANNTYLQVALDCWEFIKTKLIDKTHGEWFWGIGINGEIMPGEDKVGIWKCPYHNSRACMELIKRINNKHS